MHDYYNDGYKDGYGTRVYGDRDYPQTDQDKDSYERGRDHGRRRKEISDELEREGY